MFRIGFFAACFSLLSASAFASPTQCELPPDQGMGSLRGKWDGLPIKLVFDREFYETNEGRDVAAMKRAVNTWNQWALLKGKVAFIIVGEGRGSDIPDLVNSCSQFSYTEAVPLVVGVWKITGEGKRANQREACGRDESGKMQKILPTRVQAQVDWRMSGTTIQGASVLMNFEDYNRPGMPEMDVESLFLHQLGHVLGLLHSCNGSNSDSADSTSAPACEVAPKEYTDAVMYPFLLPNEKRTTLQKNDFDRVNCLY